jgi:hypothetical protein
VDEAAGCRKIESRCRTHVRGEIACRGHAQIIAHARYNAWDMFGGGFPLAPLLVELRAMNLPSLMRPSADASRMEALRGLWSAAGVEAVETRKIAVQRTFADFHAFWGASANGSNATRIVNEMTPGDVDVLKKGRVPT